MKTPAEWDQELLSNPWKWKSSLHLIEEIQCDALNSPFANTTDQQEIELARERADKAKLEVRRLNYNIEVYKERWHQARRYLRAANKGAERNNMVMRLQAADISRLLERIKQLEQRP